MELAAELTTLDKPRIDLGKAIDLRMRGLSLRDIARQFDCSHETIRKKIDGLVPNGQDIRAYKENRAALFAGKQLDILNSMTAEQLEKESYAYKVKSLETLHRMELLEDNRPTSIVETRSINVQVNFADRHN